MDKKDIARILEETAQLMELAGENAFKARSYANVARQLEQYEGDLETLAHEGRLEELKGVGKGLASKIAEIIETGDLTYRHELRSRFPEGLFELFAIPNLGAKRIRVLYEELGVSSLAELEYACTENRLLALKGFGEKSQKKVLDGIEHVKKHRDRRLLSEALKEAKLMVGRLGSAPGVLRISEAGSVRRRRETCKDADIVASSKEPAAVMAAFCEAEGVERVAARGDTKSSVVTTAGLPMDLRVVSDEQFPYALAHFTGSKEHNVEMRRRAKERGLKLNEYGLFEGENLVRCATEAELYNRLGLPFIPPELREDRGEFELAATPSLLEVEDLVGVFHCHSNYSDGRESLEVMAEAARSRGYAYLLVADHSQSAYYAGGLKPEAVRRQQEEIDALNARYDGFRVLKGIESDILTDGALDYEAEVLASFDLVIGSVHSKLNMDEEEATARLLRAIESDRMHILGHPSGRLLLTRSGSPRAGYPLDYARIFEACAAHRVAVEINANPHRLDCDWRHLAKANELGVKAVIGPDAHDVAGLDDVIYGVSMARKGGLGRTDMLNSLPLEELLAWRDSR